VRRARNNHENKDSPSGRFHPKKPESRVVKTASARSNQVKPNRQLSTSAGQKAGLPTVKKTLAEATVFFALC
jgi:BRCT domain type II-containing protein